MQAHRVFYGHHVGAIPDGLQLDHLCRVRNCVNPSHLEPVTPKINVARSTTRKLSESEIDEIRVLLGTMKQRDIAAKFGVSPATVSHIGQGLIHRDRMSYRRFTTGKLTDEQKAEIRSRAGSQTQRSLAREFGVSESVVSLLISGKKRRKNRTR